MKTKKLTPCELLASIVGMEVIADDWAAKIKAAREKLAKEMKKRGAEMISCETHEALRYSSKKDEAVLNELMPRKPAVGKIRQVIDGELLEKYQKSVRRACTKHVEYKLKIQKATRKTELTKAA